MMVSDYRLSWIAWDSPGMQEMCRVLATFLGGIWYPKLRTSRAGL